MSIAPHYDSSEFSYWICFTAEEHAWKTLQTHIAKKTYTDEVKSLLLENIQSICSGDNHVVLLDTEGSVWRMGANNRSQVATNIKKYMKEPQKLEELENIREICCASHHTACIDNDDNLWTFGHNGYYGKLGIGTTTKQISPCKVLGATNVQLVACGENHTLYITQGGELWGFGANNHCQILEEATSGGFRPIRVPFFAGKVVNKVFCFLSESFCIDDENIAYGFGENGNGKVGVGLEQGIVKRPTEIGKCEDGSPMPPIDKIAGTCWCSIFMAGARLYYCGTDPPSSDYIRNKHVFPALVNSLDDNRL